MMYETIAFLWILSVFSALFAGMWVCDWLDRDNARLAAIERRLAWKPGDRA